MYSRMILILVTMILATCLSSAGTVMAQADKEITNSIGMKLVLIPKGNFMMGSPPSEEDRMEGERQYEVTLTQDYYLGAFEVTQAQYQKVMGNNPSFFAGDEVGNVDSSNRPVEQVSWEDAMKFCLKLSALRKEKAAGRVYRLPTEAEWEYACRAGSSTAFSFGDKPDSLDDYAWYRENSNKQTHPVGEKKPNAWGLYDMHGNVWEWCSDWYKAYPKGAVSDPTGPSMGTWGGYRVLRGGSWGGGAASCRSSYRYGNPPANRLYGFRVALSSPEIPK